MSQSGVYSTTGGGGGSGILTETASSGGAISPDGGGNLNVIGTNGLVTSGNAGTNTIGLTNTRNVSKYVVSSDGLSQYTTIQSAINQAVTDGASAATPLLVWVLPGTYIENVVFNDYVFVSGGGDGVYIVGACTYPSAGGVCIVENLSISSFNASGALVVSGSGQLTFKFGSITAGTTIGLYLQDSFTTNLINTTLTAPNSGSTVLFMDGSTLNVFGGSMVSNDTRTEIGSNAIVNFNSCQYSNAGFLLTGTCSVTCVGCSFMDPTSDYPNFDIGAGTSCNAYSCVFDSKNTGNYFIKGAGSFNYSDSPPIRASQIESTVNQHGAGVPVSRILDAATRTIEDGATYLANGNIISASITFLLPATAKIGTFFTIISNSNFGYTITQNAGQAILQGNSSTTVGVTGLLTATQAFTTVTLMCVIQNTAWIVTSSSGTFTLA